MTPNVVKMSAEDIRNMLQILRRHLDAEIERVEQEIARLAVQSASSNFASASSPQCNENSINFASAPSPQCNEISRNYLLPQMPGSSESFLTAEDSDQLSNVDQVKASSSIASPPVNASFPPLKIPCPPFVPQNIEMWFWAMEKWFAGTNVRDDDHRFAAILLALPMSTASIFKSQLDNPPFFHKYEFAKNLIIRHFSRNEFDRIKTLIDVVDLGDSKPSELYANMRQIAGEVVSLATLKGLWIMRLPEQWRSSLALTSNDPLEFLRAADMMFEVTPRSSIFLANDSSRVAQCNTVAGSVLVKKKNVALSQQEQHAVNSGICPFHARFGAKARNCRAPCKWKNKETAAEK